MLWFQRLHTSYLATSPTEPPVRVQNHVRGNFSQIHPRCKVTHSSLYTVRCFDITSLKFTLPLPLEVNKKLAAELDAKGTDIQHAGQGPFHKKKRLCFYRILHSFWNTVLCYILYKKDPKISQLEIENCLENKNFLF